MSFTIGAPSGDGSTQVGRRRTYRSGGLAVCFISVDVHQVIAPSGAAAVNTYDNESPDINGDSIQLYLSSDKGLGAWILVPETDSSECEIRQLEGWSARSLRLGRHGLLSPKVTGWTSRSATAFLRRSISSSTRCHLAASVDEDSSC